MDIFLWILQILLAAAFLGSAVVKNTVAKDDLKARMPYVEDFSQGQIRAIGLIEGVAAIGLVLPWATGIAPILTPLAAVGLVITMVVAALVHRRRGESIAFNLVLAALALIVAIGRF